MPVTGPPVSGILFDHAGRHAVLVSGTVLHTAPPPSLDATQECAIGTYEDVFRASTEDPESFWLTAAEGIDWGVAPRRDPDASGAPFYR
jgi:hypothetical protein